MNKEPMLCGLCKEEVRPLDAHTGYVNGKLGTFHIDCWNGYNKRQQELLGTEYQSAKANFDAQMGAFRNLGDTQ
jgi:hypothetical protein